MSTVLKKVLNKIDNSLAVEGDFVRIADEGKFRKQVGVLVEISALDKGEAAGWARYLVRKAALELGVYPASIHDLYMARGRGDAPITWSTPAFNLRALSYHAARAMFRAALGIEGAAFIFEIARSEIGYTGQRPTEYATNILAAAIAEGYAGPVFIQGDHFQVSAARYQANADAEISALKNLITESLDAGFYNIDIDTSTLVDLRKATVPEQQELNYKISAELGAYVRAQEPPNVTASIGGEIGEVGEANTTKEELHAFMTGYREEFAKLAPQKPGLSKLSIQTGTSHGGTVLADGSIAAVKLDFDTLRNLSIVARKKYGLGGTVQHGASTLPEEMFDRFPKNEAIEVHLATNFMNMFYEIVPHSLRDEMYAWLDENYASSRKEGMTDEQFYYKTRKYAIAPFKAKMYALPEEEKEKLAMAWEAQFAKLFDLLGVGGTKKYVDEFISPVSVSPRLDVYLSKDAAAEDVSDLAD